VCALIFGFIFTLYSAVIHCEIDFIKMTVETQKDKKILTVNFYFPLLHASCPGFPGEKTRKLCLCVVESIRWSTTA